MPWKAFAMPGELTSSRVRLIGALQQVALLGRQLVGVEIGQAGHRFFLFAGSAALQCRLIS